MRKIPFHKAHITKKEIDGVSRAIRSGWLTMGPKTVKFEEKFADYIGARYAVAVNSCTAAMHLALEAIGLKEGDEVLVPAITFTATSEVVCYFGAKPVFVDVEHDTINMDAAKLEGKINKRTKAIITVHYGGQPVDIKRVNTIAQKYGLFVIEDAAHALPSTYANKLIGNFSDMTCFSFYATKTLATGEGGMLTTRNRKWAEKIRIMRLHGMSRDAWKRYSGAGSWYYEITDVGYKYNMTDIQAVLGLSQLEKVEAMWKKRAKIATAYSKAFESFEGIEVPIIKPDRETSWHLYVIKLDLNKLCIDRDRFIKELHKRGVATSVHFIPLYRQPFYKKKFGYKNKDFPVSENLYKRIISLPIYPSMGKKEIDYVIAQVGKIAKKYTRK